MFKEKRDFLWVLMGRGIQVVISVLSLKFLTQVLDKKQVGLFFIFTAVLTYFGLAIVSPLGHYCNRQFHIWKRGGVLLSRLGWYFFYVFASCVFFTALAFPFRAHFSQYFSYGEFASFILWGVLSNTIVVTFIPYLNMLEQRGVFVLLTCLNLFFSLCSSLLSVHFFSASALHWFWGQFVAQTLFALLSFLVFKSHLKEKASFPRIEEVNAAALKRVWTFAHPIALSSFFLWFILDGHRYILESRFGLAFVAEISVGFAIAQRISYALESVIQQLFLPAFYKQCESGGKEKTKEALEGIVSKAHPFYFASTAFVIFTAPFLIRLLASESYLSAYPFVIAGALFHFFRKYSALATLGSHGLYQTRLLLAPHAFTAFFLLLSLLLIGKSVISVAVPSILVLSSLGLFLFLNGKMVGELSFSLLSSLKKTDVFMCLGGGSAVGMLLWPWAQNLFVSLGAFLFFGAALAFYFYKKHFLLENGGLPRF